MDFISGRASLSGSVRAVFWGSDIVFEADHQQLYRVEETGGSSAKILH